MTVAERYGKVAVLMGGRSAEREISLRSGAAVLAALKAAGAQAEGLDVQGPDALARLATGGYARVFIALHGRGGEDGSVQGALEWLGLPYTGSGVLGSALAMDKLRTKQLWQAAGLPTPPWRLIGTAVDEAAAVAELGLPLMIKPACEGSSIGMSKVLRAEDLHAACALARRYDTCVLAERCIVGAEYTAAVVGDQALPLIRLETPRAFYDYEAKYHATDTRYYCPAGLPEAQELALRALARRALDVLDVRGWGRVDLLLDESGAPFLIEANTVPGMTDHSLVPMAAQAAGLSFEALTLRILDSSLPT